MTDRRYRYAATALFGVLLATEPAFAQIAGGGGQGLLNQVIQWFVDPTTYCPETAFRRSDPLSAPSAGG